MFKTVDTDGNGSVSKEELKVLLDSLNKNPISPEILDEIYNNLDEDNRDGLDFIEFK
jgi:Ca2+-binding EF-hand superfamily protein